jgi:hypothetical protein
MTQTYCQGPSITKKKNTILFFVYFGTHNNKNHTIYKQTRVFVFIFSMFLFCFYIRSQYAMVGPCLLSEKITDIVTIDIVTIDIVTIDIVTIDFVTIDIVTIDIVTADTKSRTPKR